MSNAPRKSYGRSVVNHTILLPIKLLYMYKGVKKLYAVLMMCDAKNTYHVVAACNTLKLCVMYILLVPRCTLR